MEVDSKKKFNLEFNNLLILYRHYKDYFLPLGVILACVLVVFWVVIPQFQQYLNSQQELKAQVQKLEVLKTNYNFLSNLDSSQSNANLTALTLALPSGKDFAGMMNAVSIASAKTGVSVGDFQFALGSLSGVDSTQGTSAYPSIKIDINLAGDTQSIFKFAQELYKTSPASEVASIKVNGGSASVTILFYYKPFISQNVDDSQPITILSGQDQALIKNVTSWNSSANQSQLPSISSLLSGTSSQGGSLGSNSSPF